MDHSRTIPNLLAELAASYQQRRTLAESADEEQPLDDQLGLEQKMLSLLLELLPVGVSILDGDRKVVFQNSTLLKILDMNAEGIQTGAYQQRKYLSADGTPLDSDGFASVRAERSGQAVYNVETGILKENGDVIWVNVSAVPLDLPDWKMVIVTSDITERKRLDLSLRESEQRYTLLFQKSTIPAILLKLPEVTIADANEAAEALTGFTQEEMLDRTAAELGIISQAQRSEAIRQFEHVGTLAENEKHIFTKTGEVRIVVSRTNPIELGGQHFAITTLEDVTEQKKSREELALTYNTLAEAQKIAHLGSFEYIAATQTTLWSEEEYRIYGLDPAGPSPEYNTMLQKCIHPDDAVLLHETFTKAMQSNSVYELEHRVVRPDGSVRWVYDRALPYFNQQGGIVRYIGITLDITERKHMEDELRRSNAELEQFAYVASHDLQEPLRAMAGMVQLLQQRYQGQLDERADQYINLAVEASTRMQALINDLLTFSRVDRRGKPFEAVPMQTSVQTALKNLAVAVQESGAEVTWEALPTVRADGGQMVQLFQNLIGNAIKFRGDKEPRIHIQARQVEDTWQVSVQDNGIGIEPQYFERIFQVFQRLHTRAEYPGTGIGLALCKKIVERHGGVIRVESTPGAGSTFHFTIPNRRKSDVSNPRP